MLEEEESADEYFVLGTKADVVPPLKKSVFINDVKLEIEVNTGVASVSTSISSFSKRLQGQLKIRKLELQRPSFARVRDKS